MYKLEWGTMRNKPLLVNIVRLNYVFQYITQYTLTGVIIVTKGPFDAVIAFGLFNIFCMPM